jgi:hypothetical protein
MRFNKVQIKNYKSFRDSGAITFGAGMNVIVGKNSAGKTALLEALSLAFSSKPHTSVRTKPRVSSPVDTRSSVAAHISVPVPELKDIILTIAKEINVPVRRNVNVSDERALRAFLEELFSTAEVSYDAVFETTSGAAELPTDAFVCSYKISMENGRAPYAVATVGPDFTLDVRGQTKATGSQDYGRAVINELRRQRVYGFKAERLNVGACAFGNRRELWPNANNLPEALNWLQSNNVSRFERYNKLVNRIFPSIQWVSARPIGNQQLELVLSSIDPREERADLIVPLSESGTGIGQVLAILYVVLNSDYPSVILVDEPNSFLHPEA